MIKLPSESCHQWIRRVQGAASYLALYNHPVGQEDVAYRLFSGLPDEFRPLRTALMAMGTDSHRLGVTRESSAILTEEKSIRPLFDTTSSSFSSRKHSSS